MGFLKRELNKAIKRAAKKTAKPKKQSSVKNQTIMNIAPWMSCPEYARLVEIDGDDEKTIYVYDSEPLKGIRKGQTVSVDIYRGDITMRSRHTGTVCNSVEYDDVVVLYENKPIGFTSIPRADVIKSAKSGYVLRFKAKCYGTLEGYSGCKEMKMLVPSRFNLNDWLK